MTATAKCIATPDAATFPARAPDWTRNGLTAHWLSSLDALVVSKNCPGFEVDDISALRGLLAAAARGDFASLKYLVFDFAHPADARPGPAPEGFGELVAALADLILDAPVISVAWARSTITGCDLDFALYCAVTVAEREARFCFDGDPDALFGLCAGLSRKIGFVRAERLIDAGETLSAEEMRELGLARDVVEPRDGYDAFEDYIRKCGRRYNANCAVFKAQQIAMPGLVRRSG